MTSDAPARSLVAQLPDIPHARADRGGRDRSRRSARCAAWSSSAWFQSWSTQVCGPGSRGASHRIIDPVPLPRSWTTTGARVIRAAFLASVRDRDRASASSRRLSHSTETGMTSLIAHPPASTRSGRRCRSIAGGSPCRAAPRRFSRSRRPGSTIHRRSASLRARRLTRWHEDRGAGLRPSAGSRPRGWRRPGCRAAARRRWPCRSSPRARAPPPGRRADRRASSSSSASTPVIVTRSPMPAAAASVATRSA